MKGLPTARLYIVGIADTLISHYSLLIANYHIIAMASPKEKKRYFSSTACS